MKRRAWKSVVVLSILVGSYTLAAPANATLWQNDDLRFGRLYFTLVSGSTNIFARPYTGLTAEAWGASADPNAAGFFRFISAVSTPTNQLVLDIPNGMPYHYISLQVYHQNGGANQSWLPVLRFWDALGAACYSFHSRVNTGMVMVQEADIEGHWVTMADWTQSLGQYWCAYTVDGAGNVVPQNPRPF